MSFRSFFETLDTTGLPRYFIVMKTLVCLEVLHVRANPFHLTPLHDWKLANSYFLVFNALAFNLCWIYDIIYLPD